jgi:hypothetical protein
MTPVIVYIQQLLLEHECVVIPQLGALITANQGSKIDFVDKSILPPSKIISFNRAVSQNDGLLINRIHQQENMTYEQSTLVVKQWVALIHSRLVQKEIVNLEAIGTLRMDYEGNIQFQEIPSQNYDLQSYGLPKLTLQPIVKDSHRVEAIESFVRQQNDAIHEVIIPFATAGKVKKRRNVFAYAAVMLALIGLAIGSFWILGAPVPNCEWIQHNEMVSFFKNVSFPALASRTPAKPAVAAPKVEQATIIKNTEEQKIEKSLQTGILPHHYSYYLENPSQEYFLIFYQTQKQQDAERMRMKYRSEGMDTRILKIDSTYNVTFYFFKKKTEIEAIKHYFEDTCHYTITVFSKATY